MNEDALSPADESRRDVLLGGLMATVAAGLPATGIPPTAAVSSSARSGAGARSYSVSMRE